MPQTAVDILLVEDNEGDVALVKQSLRECEFAVNLRIARDGEEALHILGDAAYAPHLVILDLNLPKVPGLTVLELAHRRETAFVIFSSSCSSEETKRALQLGARACVQKPIDITDFIRAICSMVETAAAGVAS